MDPSRSHRKGYYSRSSWTTSIQIGAELKIRVYVEKSGYTFDWIDGNGKIIKHFIRNLGGGDFDMDYA